MKATDTPTPAVRLADHLYRFGQREMTLAHDKGKGFPPYQGAIYDFFELEDFRQHGWIALARHIAEDVI